MNKTPASTKETYRVLTTCTVFSNRGFKSLRGKSSGKATLCGPSVPSKNFCQIYVNQIHGSKRIVNESSLRAASGRILLRGGFSHIRRSIVLSKQPTRCSFQRHSERGRERRRGEEFGVRAVGPLPSATLLLGRTSTRKHHIPRFNRFCGVSPRYSTYRYRYVCTCERFAIMTS